jgi:hypothetical protein
MDYKMKLITELLQITQDAETGLMERLGNLAQLKVGNMINVLKQRQQSFGRHGETRAGAVGNKFISSGYHRSQGHNSEIVDAGKVEDIAALRRAYKKQNDGATAFSLYVKNKAVAFGAFESHDLAGSSRTGLMAFDFTMFKDKLEAKRQETVDKQTSTFSKNNVPPAKISSYSEKTRDFDWQKEGKAEKYQGELMSTGSLKEFFVSLKQLAGDDDITCKLVLVDSKSQDKRRERNMNPPPSEHDLHRDLEALKKRLLKFKLSKKPTADTIEEFIKATVTKSAKIVQFDGRAFSTTESKPSDINPLSLLKGGSFDIAYATVDPNEYDSLYISYHYDTETMCIVPYKAKWTGKNEDGDKESTEAVLNTKSYMKKEHGISDAADKKEVMTKLLTAVKDGNTLKARKMIKSLRDTGTDYPEFKTVEKSLDADEAAKKAK